MEQQQGNTTSKPVGDYEVARAMERFGGSFVRRLGEMAHHADPDNLARLKAAFPEYWAEYRSVAQANQRLAEMAR